jgi:hypothetical protein
MLLHEMTPQAITLNDGESATYEVQQRRLSAWRTGALRAHPAEHATSTLPTAHPATPIAIGSPDEW